MQQTPPFRLYNYSKKTGALSVLKSEDKCKRKCKQIVNKWALCLWFAGKSPPVRRGKALRRGLYAFGKGVSPPPRL